MRFLMGFFLILTAMQARADGFCLQHFNLYGALYASEIYDRTQKAISEITQNASPCEVIQLNEVWNQSQILQVMSLLRPQYQISAPNLSARHGLMSSFRAPILAEKTYDFSVNNQSGLLDSIRQWAHVKKSFHVVLSSLPQMQENIYFVNTHLHPTSAAVRIAQILDLYRWRLEHQDSKMILSGDFHADPGSVERNLAMGLLSVRDSLEEALGGYQQDHCTYCRQNPRSWLMGNHIFDYVFFSNVSNHDTALQVVSGEINLKGESDRSLSDHYGVKIHFSQHSQKSDRSSSREHRRTQLLENIQMGLQILLAAQKTEFASAAELLEQVRHQLLERQGPYWDYFTRD